MNSRAKNLTIAFLALTTLGGAAMVVQARRELAALRAAPTLQVTRSEFTAPAAPAALPAAPAAVAQAEALVAEPAERPQDGPGAGQRGERGGPGGGGRFMAQMAELMKDPEFAAAWKLEQEARIDQRYGSLFAQLNLPPDKLAALRELLAERENAGREVFASAVAQGLNPREARDQLRELAGELEAEVDANISTTLGAHVLDSIKSYNNSAPQRNVVNDLSQRLVATGQTLNSSQSTALTQVLAETAEQNGRSVTITDATIARAQGVLTPAQVDTLRSLQAEQQARAIIETKMRAAREASGQGGNRRNNN